ncbi:MAG: hypothetical protein K0R67_1777 [Paenibacillus sp.]|jgi:chemotaxis protein histidine kinase CheA|nr:hypothetical protein [Paenibacillus sp.]
MSNPEFEAKLNRIIKMSQQMYIKDAAPRITEVQLTLAEWKAGRIQSAAAAKAIYLQIHTMKGVALTIHFEPMHQICEALIAILEREDMQAAETLIEQLPAKLADCEAIVTT